LRHYNEKQPPADAKRLFFVIIRSYVHRYSFFESHLPGFTLSTDPARLDVLLSTHAVAMSGEITIMGKVLGVGGIQPKLMAAIDAGVKMVILPAENERDVQNLPDYIKNRIEVQYVMDIQQVLRLALINN